MLAYYIVKYFQSALVHMQMCLLFLILILIFYLVNQQFLSLKNFVLFIHLIHSVFFLSDPKFTEMQHDFMEKYYRYFDECEENKLEYMDIFKTYVSSFLSSKINLDFFLCELIIQCKIFILQLKTLKLNFYCTLYLKINL